VSTPAAYSDPATSGVIRCGGSLLSGRVDLPPVPLAADALLTIENRFSLFPVIVGKRGRVLPLTRRTFNLAAGATGFDWSIDPTYGLGAYARIAPAQAPIPPARTSVPWWLNDPAASVGEIEPAVALSTPASLLSGKFRLVNRYSAGGGGGDTAARLAMTPTYSWAGTSGGFSFTGYSFDWDQAEPHDPLPVIAGLALDYLSPVHDLAMRLFWYGPNNGPHENNPLYRGDMADGGQLQNFVRMPAGRDRVQLDTYGANVVEIGIADAGVPGGVQAPAGNVDVRVLAQGMAPRLWGYVSGFNSANASDVRYGALT
jgi:hypothetical protein